MTSITDQLFTNRRFGLDETCDVRHDAVDFLFHRDTRGGARMTSGDTKASGLRPTRRTVVKGAAWAVPAITLATAAPAHAASPIPPNGLNGWVTLSRSCSRNPQFSIDGRGNFTGGGANDRGIWTFVPAPGGTAPTFAEIIFYFDRVGWSFANSSGPGWSNLERYPAGDSGAPAGFYAYRTVYTGGWTFVDRPGESQDAWVADSDPYWLENDMPGSCTTVCAYARRTITVNGVTVSFRRGPVCV